MNQILTQWEIEKNMLETIRTHFPDISWELYEVFDNWWDNQVVMLDNHLIFRFPRNEYVKNIHQNEEKLLNLAGKYVDLSIPNYTLLTNDHSCVWYEAIAGIPMTVAIYQELPNDTKEYIQTQIADFLTQLHSIPLDELGKIWYTHKKWGSEYFKNDFLTTCRHLFTDEEIDIVLNYINELNNLDSSQKVLTHCDIQQKNIFIDDKLTHLTWVIDFSDAIIADPALDFGRLSEYWEDFMNGVYKNYRWAKDDIFLDRALFYNKRLAIFMLTDAVQKDKDIEENLEIFREIFFNDIFS